MTAQRFYVNQPLQLGQVPLPRATAHHLSVLRLRIGDAVQLFNGDGQVWLGTVSNMDKTNCCVTISQCLDDDTHDRELPFSITIAQSLIEPSKMDWVVEKAVELGVAKVRPITASRSVTKLDPERSAKRVLHWQAIATAASEQCGRNRVMSIEQPSSIATALKTVQGAALLLHPEGGVTLQSWCTQQHPQPVTLWIGPEGGWSHDEIMQLELAGAQRITFGSRVLRTESAAAAIAAGLQALWCTG